MGSAYSVADSMAKGAVADSLAHGPSTVAVLAGPGMVGILLLCPFDSHRSKIFTAPLTPLCCVSIPGLQLRPLGSVMLGALTLMCDH